MSENQAIVETLFEKPSGNVRGSIGAFLSIGGKRKRVAFTMLLTDAPPDVSLEVPRRVPLADIPALAAVLTEFSTRVAELASTPAAKPPKLAPGETAFMASVAEEFEAGDFKPQAGASVSYEFNETRSARGAEKKGLVEVHAGQKGAGGNIVLTKAGAAWISAHLATKPAKT